MRTERDCDDFAIEVRARLESCPLCGGISLRCPCVVKAELFLRAFTSCIPRDFWGYKATDVEFNKPVFRKIIIPYCRRMRTALRKGYGILLLGDNGSGKTMFLSYVLMSACRLNFSAYYTTMSQLAHDTKRGFSSRADADRLEWYLSSDFLVIDELAKERFREGDNFTRVELERVLKSRYDNALPTLIATNASMRELEEFYGPTLISMLTGKYQTGTMQPGDFRHRMRRQMETDMGDKVKRRKKKKSTGSKSREGRDKR
jgi:hypothetical protein